MEQPQRALQETERLFAAARAILGATDLKTICEELTHHFVQLVHAERTIIYLVDHARRKVTLTVCGGRPSGYELSVTYAELEQGISGLVFKSGRPSLSVDTDDGIEPEATRARRRLSGIGALCVVPLIARGQVIGTITAANLVGQRLFAQHDLDLLMALAAQAGAAIDNVRLLEETQRQVARWESISALSQITSLQLNEEELFELLYRQTLQLTRLTPDETVFFIARYLPERQKIAIPLHYEQGERQPPTEFAYGQGFSSWIVRHNRPLLVQDVMTQQAEFGYEAYVTDLAHRTGRVARACLGVPLCYGSQVTGVLSVQSLGTQPLTDDHLALLSMWAGPIAVALENARLVEALRQQTAELQARNAELDAFAHTVAHNLKNPLQVILGYTRSSVLHYAELSEKALKGNLVSTNRAAQKLNNIVEELLLLAGVRQAAQVPLQPLDMAVITGEAQERLLDLIEQYDAEIILPEAWPAALGYGPWVEEVWANYLSNAIVYGGTPPRVELGATAAPGQPVRFWVRDNGQGLSAEEQGRLFIPFERLSQAHAKGHGLGLSIVRRIVAKLGGEVGVESAPEGGSRFYFTLPPVPGPPPVMPA